MPLILYSDNPFLIKTGSFLCFFDSAAIQQIINHHVFILMIIKDQFHILNGLICKQIRKGNVLGDLGLQIQTVALGRYHIHIFSAFVNGIKKSPLHH